MNPEVDVSEQSKQGGTKKSASPPARYLRIARTTVAFLGIVLLVGFLWYRQQDRYRDGTEKIAPISEAVPYTVRGGQVFFRSDSNGGLANAGMAMAVGVPGTKPVEPAFVMDGITARDGSQREIFRESLKGQLVADALPVDGAVLYLTQTNEPGGSQPAPSARLTASELPPLPSVRRFLPVPPPKNENGKWQRFPRRLLPSSQPVLLHRRPIDGNPATKIRLDIDGYRLSSLTHILTEEGVYWMRPVWKEQYFITEERKGNNSPVMMPTPPTLHKAMAKGGPPGMAMGTKSPTLSVPVKIVTEEIYQGDDLMFSPADGGPVQKRASGLVLESLSVSEDAIFGFGLCPTPGHSRAVYRIARRRNTPPVNLHNFPMVNEEAQAIGYRDSLFLEHQDRLYWIERYKLEDDETSSITNQETGRLVSTRLDGSDRRVVWEARDAMGKLMFPKQIFAYQGKLYMVFSQARVIPVPPPEELRIEWNHGVVRIESERNPSLGTMLALPRSAYFQGIESVALRPTHADNGYLYFLIREEKRSPVDFLFTQTTEKAGTTLCRIKLPE